jgi:hypothetical protein
VFYHLPTDSSTRPNRISGRNRMPLYPLSLPALITKIFRSRPVSLSSCLLLFHKQRPCPADDLLEICNYDILIFILPWFHFKRKHIRTLRREKTIAPAVNGKSPELLPYRLYRGENRNAYACCRIPRNRVPLPHFRYGNARDIGLARSG